MTPTPASTAFFTASSLVLAGAIFVAMRMLMARSPANLCIAGFLALVIPGPLMLVVHPSLALAMVGLGVACVVPAYLLAEDHEDDGRGGGGGAPDPPKPDAPNPSPDFDPQLWSEFERDFWSHVERERERELVVSA